MGNNLAPVDLGTGRTAKLVSAGHHFTCVILVSCGEKRREIERRNRSELGLWDVMLAGEPVREGVTSVPSGLVSAAEMVVLKMCGRFIEARRADGDWRWCWAGQP